MTPREKAERFPLTWDPVRGGRLPLIHWEDFRDVDLGPDPTGERFAQMADLMMRGEYYPPEVVRFMGRFRDEGRDLRVGDRVLQRFPFIGIVLWSGVEIWLARRQADACEIGYVTTRYHHGRGIWQAKLERKDGALRLVVKAKLGPQSWLFWLGLPVARAVQAGTREAAIRRFEGMR